MERLYTTIIGSYVLDDSYRRPITTVKDLVIDPENGKIVAFVVNHSKNQIIAPMDIMEWTHFLRVHDASVIIPADDVLRVEEVQKRHIHFYRAKVETKAKKYLGRVVNMVFDTRTDSLVKIYVAKEILGLIRYDSRILTWDNIVEVRSNKIIVKEDLGTVKELSKAEKVTLEDLASA